MGHAPIYLEAFDAEALTTLIRLWRAGDLGGLGEAIAARDNCEPPSARKPFAVRAEKLAARGAPDILVAYERAQADPKAWALEQLAAVNADHGDEEEIEVAIIGLCRCARLQFRDDVHYKDIAWWAGLNHQHAFSDPDGINDHEIWEQWLASSLRHSLFGATTFTVDGTPLDTFLAAEYQREIYVHTCHSPATLREAHAEIAGISERESPPASLYHRSAAGRSTRSLCFENPHDEPLPQHVVDRQYPRLVAAVRACMSRVLQFHERCLARGWHVHVGGEF